MVHGPKEKKERALGERLQLKGERCKSPKCAMIRKPYRPGMHGKKRRRALSDFGRQLQEKQKFKISYNLNEGNLRQLFNKAAKKTGSVADRLLELLESRLDNVVFRLGFAPSRAMARQLLIHGHITVNGRRVRAPGYEVKPDDVIAIRKESADKIPFKELRESLKKYELPSWLYLDIDKLEGKVLSRPKDMTLPFEINLLVESFSK